MRSGASALPALFPRCGLLLLAVLCLTAAVYWPGLSGAYVFDDFPNLVQSPALPLTSLTPGAIAQAVFSNHSGPGGRPLAMLTFALESYWAGMDPGVMKGTNLVIHLVNGILVFALLRRLSGGREPAVRGGAGSDGLALLVTAAWLLAPINLTGVLFVVQRMESLAALFTFAGLLVFVIGRERMLAGGAAGVALVWAGLAGGTALGVLAKESAAMLPVYALAIEFVLFRGRDAGGALDRRVFWLFALVLVLPGVLGVLWLAPGILSGRAFASRPFGPAERLWTEGRAMWSYMAWTFAPRPDALTLYHDAYPLSKGWLTPLTTLPAALGLAGLAAAALWLRRRWPLAALGILWFLGGHLLVSTALPLELVYEHRNYVPSAGLLLAGFALLLTLGRQRLGFAGARLAFALGLVTVLALVTGLRASTWGDPLLLAVSEARNQPDSPRAHYELGMTLTRLAPEPSAHPFQRGIAEFETAAALPLAGLLPDQALIYLSAKHGLPADPRWWQRLRRIIATRALAAQDINALYSLVNCRIKNICPLDVPQLGRTLAAAVRHHPKRAQLHTIYANYAANITHDYPLARRLMQRSVALAPRSMQYWENLVTLQIALGEKRHAAASLARMRELGAGAEALAAVSASWENQFNAAPHAP